MIATHISQRTIQHNWNTYRRICLYKTLLWWMLRLRKWRVQCSWILIVWYLVGYKMSTCQIVIARGTLRLHRWDLLGIQTLSMIFNMSLMPPIPFTRTTCNQCNWNVITQLSKSKKPRNEMKTRDITRAPWTPRDAALTCVTIDLVVLDGPNNQ